MDDTTALPAEARDADARDRAIETASARGAYWTGSRLFVALSAMIFGSGAFAYFYLHSVDNNTLWHPSGQRPSDFVSISVLTFVVVGAGLFWWYSRSMLAGTANPSDWRVAAGVAAAFFLAAGLVQFWGMTRTGFYPGSSGYASVYVAVMPLFAVYCLGAAYWVETVFARSLRAKHVLSPDEATRDSDDVVSFTGTVVGAKLFVVFVAIVGATFFVLFSVLK